MVCLGVLWNSVQEYKDDVINDISKYGTIINYFSLNLEDEYEQFVRDIYSCDEIAEWKVDKKVETMFNCSDSRIVTIVFIDIETKEQMYHIYKKRMIYTNLENMKTKIREKYSQIVSNYFFDNIFHVTDDEKEFKDDLNVVSGYLRKKLEQNEQKRVQKRTRKLKNELN